MNGDSRIKTKAALLNATLPLHKANHLRLTSCKKPANPNTRVGKIMNPLSRAGQMLKLALSKSKDAQQICPKHQRHEDRNSLSSKEMDDIVTAVSLNDPIDFNISLSVLNTSSSIQPPVTFKKNAQ